MPSKFNIRQCHRDLETAKKIWICVDRQRHYVLDKWQAFCIKRKETVNGNFEKLLKAVANQIKLKKLDDKVLWLDETMSCDLRFWAVIGSCHDTLRNFLHSLTQCGHDFSWCLTTTEQCLMLILETGVSLDTSSESVDAGPGWSSSWVHWPRDGADQDR